MTRYNLQLLGTFHLTCDGAAVTNFHSDKARALLAYVASEHATLHSRATLATRFWPDSDQRAALTNLRNALAGLRSLAPELLTITRTTVQWDASAAAEVDVQQFRALIGSDPAAALQQYRGDFLAGLTPPDATEFAEWRVLWQEHLHQQMMDGLERLAATALATHAYDSAIESAQRQLAAVAWHEPAHRTLMQAYAAKGQRALALRQFERCRQVLADELAVAPSAATVAVRRAIAAEAAVRNNLPPQPTELVGRSALRDEVAAALPNARLVTLVGEGGAGKSLLALAVAHQLRDAAEPPFADGLWFVPLAGLDGYGAVVEQMAGAIAQALGVRLDPDAPAPGQLMAALHGRHALLLLDNIEHLVQAAEPLLYQLLNETRVHLLLTSRVRTQLRQEQAFRLGGLPLPAATALFRARARQVYAAFRAADAVVEAICRRLEGLPLAVELAAAWVEHWTADDLLAEIERDWLPIAPAAAAGADGVQHASLRTVFEHSWRWLAADEQRVLVQLAVFRGQIARAAVLAITGGSLTTLSALRSKSLLRLEGAGRYSLHELTRAFAAEKGQALDWLAAARRAHATYFLTAVQQQPTAALLGERDNVRAAWSYAQTPPDVALLQVAIRPFYSLFHAAGLLHDVDHQLAATEATVRGLPADHARNELLAHVLYFRTVVATPDNVLGLVQAALALTDDPILRANLHGELGSTLAELNRHADAADQFARQAAYAQQSGDALTIVQALRERANFRALHMLGDYATAIADLQEAQAILTRIGYQGRIKGDVLHALSTALMRHGDYAGALAVAAELLAYEADGAPENRLDNELNYGLMALFAGRYAEAIAANERALAIALQLDLKDAVGLLYANLGLTYRQMGDLAAARRYGTQAVAVLRPLSEARKLGLALNRLGHTLLAQGDYKDAADSYRAALAIWEPAGHTNQYEARAGLARALVALGDTAGASAELDAVLAFVTLDQIQRVVEPALLVANGAAALRALGRAADAAGLARLGRAWADMIAGRITDPAVRDAFLRMVALP